MMRCLSASFSDIGCGVKYSDGGDGGAACGNRVGEADGVSIPEPMRLEGVTAEEDAAHKLIGDGRGLCVERATVSPLPVDIGLCE